MSPDAKNDLYSLLKTPDVVRLSSFKKEVFGCLTVGDLREAVGEEFTDRIPDRHEVMQRAYKLDPECWVSYSGKPKPHKQYMEQRRVAAIAKAHKELRAEGR